jgi:hypothetical protein
VEAAKQLAAEAQLDIEREQFAEIIENIVRDSATTSVAAARLRQLMTTAKPYVSEAFRQILLGVSTEAAKKIIWPGA